MKFIFCVIRCLMDSFFLFSSCSRSFEEEVVVVFSVSLIWCFWKICRLLWDVGVCMFSVIM